MVVQSNKEYLSYKNGGFEIGGKDYMDRYYNPMIQRKQFWNYCLNGIGLNILQIISLYLFVDLMRFPAWLMSSIIVFGLFIIKFFAMRKIFNGDLN